MIGYKRFLAALDLSREASAVVDRLQELVENIEPEQILLLHVIEPVVVDGGPDMMSSAMIEVEESLLTRAEQALQTHCERFAHGVETRVEVGATKQTIQRVAREEDMDLIIVGTHGRHGLELILGSTANAVLHGTPCDVLAVRI